MGGGVSSDLTGAQGQKGGKRRRKSGGEEGCSTALETLIFNKIRKKNPKET